MKTHLFSIVFSISLCAVVPRGAEAFRIIEAVPDGSIDAGMMLPTDAAFGGDGTLYVLDGYRNRIVSRRPDGEIGSIRPAGRCALNRPLGIEAHEGKLYVADTENRRLCELGTDGVCLRSIPLGKRGEALPSRPADVAIEGGVAAVSDRGGDLLRILLYPTFERTAEVTDLGEEKGELNAPYLLDMRQGRIALTDIMNGRIVLFASGGTFLRTLGVRGVREGRFIRPKGVAIDSRGDIFVSDSTLGVVQVFDPDFVYRGVIGRGGEPIRFRHPAGLAVHGDLLAVVEQKANRVTLMRIEGSARRD